MKLGMTLPLMEPGVNREVLEAWARAVDQGPYASLCFGERMAFDNPELLTLLGACSAWTERVRLVTTIIVAQLHDPVMLAKALATGDMLSRGRLTAGFGIGGRIEDYTAAGADPAGRGHAELARRVGIMKRVWAGEKVVDTLKPVGPPPVRKGGPELLIGAQGPKAIRSAAPWADGISGFSFNLDLKDVATSFDQMRHAWAEAGRPAPRLTTAFWFALADGGQDARGQMERHLRHYFNWIEPAALEAMIPVTGFTGTAAQLKSVLARLQDLGTNEVHLIPTSDDVSQVARIADLVG
ncbi:MAG: LLM class flavin-dependent oxidoreductase [Proteobacteria bacterium]|nr:LLM class flavin-dependent oxidoreductase [Pseudomonadota bacterium]HQR03567.1 LLM class flavin-dependent oxidoreductase [Rhodocyclaceae bacterium]